MLNEIFSICAVCISVAFFNKILEKQTKEIGVLLAVGTAVIILLFTVVSLSPVVSTIENLFSTTNMDLEFAKVLFKSLGVCIVSQVAYDICKDCGENSLATIIEITAKFTLVIFALPLLQMLTGIISSLLEG